MRILVVALVSALLLTSGLAFASGKCDPAACKAVCKAECKDKCKAECKDKCKATCKDKCTTVCKEKCKEQCQNNTACAKKCCENKGASCPGHGKGKT
jgi:hypothetical protein